MNKMPSKEKKNAEKKAAEEKEETKTEQEEAAAAEPEEAKAEPDEDAAAALKAELAAEKDKYLRIAAEYDNFRKRSQKEREAIYADAKADAVSKLLPVYDNLERALGLGCTDEAFFKGIQMTMNQLEDIFAKLGVSAIEAVGQPFDPAVHNAVMHVDDESLGENVVAEELQKGFKLGDKVIRFAMVKVAN